MIQHIASLTLCLCLLLACTATTAKAQTGRDTLDAKQQSIIPIAAFTAKGDMDRLKNALNQGLDAGLTINEVKEVLVQMYAYCGFPRSLNALGVFMDVVKERKDKGIDDPAGPEARPLPTARTRLDIGTENQTKLAGAPVKGPLFDFAPAIDAFLKDHLFGDIFGRDNLDWKSRELATVSALASMDGVASQLRSHLRISMNVGLTQSQLRQLGEVLATKVGKKESENVATELQAIIAAQ